MADIKEKLQRLKKEREARAKMQPIKGVLEEVDDKEEPLTEDRLQQLKRGNQTRSKTDIIKEVWEEIDKDDHLSVKEKLQQLSKEFSQIVLEKVLHAPFIAGALETLKDLQLKKIPAFVVSGTPEDETSNDGRISESSPLGTS